MAGRKSSGKQPKDLGAGAVINNVLLAALNKGQFLVALLGLIILVFLFKIRAEDLIPFAKGIANRLENWYIVGWVFLVIESFIWYAHVKFMRRQHAKEMDRIAGEKTDLQTQLAGKKMQSSRRQKIKL